MPAKSKAMRKAAGMARAIQKGEIEAVPGTPSAEMAKMDSKDLKEFASTSEKGLPEHKRPRPKGKRGREPKTKHLKTTMTKRKF